MQVQTSRLSVIISCRASPIPLPNARAWAERAVASVLDQLATDPIGTEVIVVADGALVVGSPAAGLADHLESVFAEAHSSGRLSVHRTEPLGDVGRLRNIGAQQAQGSFLAFLSSQDWWKPGRLAWLAPWLSRHDLILATDEVVGESSDWVRAFLSVNWAVSSSGVIRRPLFDELGGFPEGMSGLVLPKRFPGLEDYAFWIRAVNLLSETDRRDRFALVKNEHVMSEEPPPLPARLNERVQAARELLTVLGVAPALPRRYWSAVLKRVAAAGKTVFRK